MRLAAFLSLCRHYRVTATQWQGVGPDARRDVARLVSSSLATDLVLDALEQALYLRPTVGELAHHSDRGVQYLSIRYIERLAEAGIEPSVGSAGDSYDNARADRRSGSTRPRSGVVSARGGTSRTRVRDAGMGRLVQELAVLAAGRV